MRLSHRAIDEKSKLQDRLLAQCLRRDTRPLRLAKANLRRWKARDGKRPRRVFLEWERILHYLFGERNCGLPGQRYADGPAPPSVEPIHGPLSRAGHRARHK